MSKKLSELSRAAQLVALTHFVTGQGNEVMFSKEKYALLAPQHIKGLNELVEHQMLEEKRTRTAINYLSTTNIGIPIRDVPGMREEESYKLFTGGGVV